MGSNIETPGGIDVPAGGDAEAALDHCRKVGDDVAEKIFGDDHVIIFRLLDKPHCGGVDMVVVLLDVFVIGVAHLLVRAHPQIPAVGKHVGFMDQRKHFFLVAFAGKFIGIAQAPRRRSAVNIP
jgi:hypothetical protein